MTNDSHWPRTPSTLSRPALTRPSINGLLPIVPTMIEPRRGASALTTCAAVPVTRPMSWPRSPAARTTPCQSSPDTMMLAATPSAARRNAPGALSYCTYCGTLLRYLVSTGPACAAKHVKRNVTSGTNVRRNVFIGMFFKMNRYRFSIAKITLFRVKAMVFSGVFQRGGKPLAVSVLVKGHLSACERWPFTGQYAAFCTVKGRLGGSSAV